MSAIRGYTPNFSLVLPNFDTAPWDAYMDRNFYIIDAVMKQYLDVQNIVGVWANSTLYTVNQRVVDSTTGRIYECDVQHTSHASNTFAQDRIANPTYWTLLDTVSVPDNSIDANKLVNGDADLAAIVAKLKGTNNSGTDYFALTSRLAETMSLKDFGATGDGTTDDTAAFVKAMTAAAGRRIVVPPGTYILDNAAVSGAKMCFVGINRPTFKFKTSGTSQKAPIVITGQKLLFIGIEFDGNKSGQSGESYGCLTQSGADTVGFIDCRFTNAKWNGLNAFDTDNVFALNCQGDACDINAMAFVTNTRASKNNNAIGCTVDQSAVNTGTNAGGIRFTANSGTYKLTKAAAINNHVVMRDNPATSGHAYLNIEFWGNVEGAEAIGNRTEGGDFGVSLSTAPNSIAMGNLIKRALLLGLENANCVGAAFVGNVIDLDNLGAVCASIDGQGTSTKCDQSLFAGNVCKGFTDKGLHIIDDGSSIQSDIGVNGNTFTTADNDGVAVYIQQSGGIILANNFARNTGGSATGGAWVSDNTSTILSVGNAEVGFAFDFQCVLQSAYTMNHVYHLSSYPGNMEVTVVSGTIGANILHMGITAAAPFDIERGDMLRRYGAANGNLWRGAKNTTPEGVVDARIGSMIQCYGIGGGFELFVKSMNASGDPDGTANWKPVHLRHSGTTANRPDYLEATAVGVLYWDTDLGKLIAWTGSGWVNVDGSSL